MQRDTDDAEAGPSSSGAEGAPPAASRGPPVMFVPPPPAPDVLPVASGGVLDLTNSHLHSLDGVELDRSLTVSRLTSPQQSAAIPKRMITIRDD
eukprot:scaffold526600_cov42-Prasinocladus_malaysianus.AAC.1